MKTLIYITLILILNHNSSNSQNIKINGIAKGFPISTQIILINFKTQTNVDTAYIAYGNFYFSVANSEPTHYGLQFGKSSNPDVLDIFIEDKDISINVNSENIDEAFVKGGIVQSQLNYFYKINKSLNEEFDNAMKDLNKASKENNVNMVDSLKETVIRIRQQRIDLGVDYINTNPDGVLSAFLLHAFIPGLSKENIHSLYLNLSPKVKNSYYAKSVLDYLELSREVSVGDFAADFSLPNISGENVSLSNFKGKYVLLEFWSSGCASCRTENKKLQKIYEDFKNKRFEIISISSDRNIDYWKRATKEDSISWISLQDKKQDKGNVLRRYNVKFLPSNYLVDPNGKIIAKDLKDSNLTKVLKNKLDY